ncbi:hypothetical protein [Sphingomonas sp. 10B4]|uniref:hypothetical protein n=1 Tax=Sphingomonas sp. 10B4 TaxID=3048575 RepID=UPI002AB4A73E|nr:hypothetical protein [Sphingomonas sp. 10B4]MDY7524635.1 hypothetical protein [Sphingomonas sp. 10B4]MEB0282410.1 hypothetical protein [Sphingomonas sp. 10B4]
MKRYLSSPALELFNRTGLSPTSVDAALEDLVWGKGSAILRSHHPLVQRIRQVTALNVVQISRRSHYVLLQIEQQKDGAPSWQYREITPLNCNFSCRGQLPTTIEVALNGELLDKLVKPAIAMGGTVIKHVGPTGDGWLTVDVTPPWHLF